MHKLRADIAFACWLYHYSWPQNCLRGRRREKGEEEESKGKVKREDVVVVIIRIFIVTDIIKDFVVKY